MAVYYNEIDAYAAEWLRNLMKEGLIPDGEVDTRSIVDVRPSDLRGFKQCHFFAGVAGWSHALRLAGWADDREIWTGSCPCQPFSVAGKGKGTADERHLWPVFFDLIRECRPSVVMGEQVASKAGRDWFSGVRSDLENVGYAVGGADLCAAGVGAPHIRQRLYWVALADADSRDPRSGRGNDGEMRGIPAAERGPEDGAVVSGRGGEGYGHCDMGHADDARLQGHGRSVGQHGAEGRQEPDGLAAASSVGDMADTDSEQLRGRHAGEPPCAPGGDAGEAWERQRVRADAGADGNIERRYMADARSAGGRRREVDAPAERRDELRNGSEESGSFWSNAIWLTGADGKARRAKPGLPLLAHGVPARVGKLRAFGNAIVPPLAAEVIRAFMEAV